jgi:chemotaxis regulatin CheY-phosphate phosphatase CheZ
LSTENFAGNIIVNLANLPDFLRQPILKKRISEFFGLSEVEKNEIINNALEAGPTIPFPNFSKLFKTWLEILTTFSEEQRQQVFVAYIDEILKNPEKLILFNLDGILEIFMSLEKNQQEIISQTVKNIVSKLNEKEIKILMIIIPNNAKKSLNLQD